MKHISIQKLLLILISCGLLHGEIYSVILGTSADNQLTKQQIQKTKNQLATSGQAGTGAAASPDDSPKCQACPACSTETPLPSFIINMYNATDQKNPISSYTFATDQNFAITSALLVVHIFPPSNSITTDGVSLVQSDSSYAIMYTLKSLDGTILQKSLQYVTSKSASNSEIDITAVKGVASIPTSISIAAITPAAAATATTAATPATTSVISGSTNSIFLPNMSQHSPATQQRIFNGVTPMSQKFLITVDASGNITATQISGMFDNDNSADTPTLASSLLKSSGSGSGSGIAITPTQGKSIQQIVVTISDGTTPQTLTFAQTNLPFDQKDLQNGLALNIHIFPPSLGLSAGSGSNYILIATLRTLDGLKLRKQMMQQVTFTNTPYQFSIAHGGSTILSSTFINPNIGSQGLNIISPINLRCLMQKNSDGRVIVSML